MINRQDSRCPYIHGCDVAIPNDPLSAANAKFPSLVIQVLVHIAM